MDFKIIYFAFVVLAAGRATVAGMLDLQREIDDVAACGGGVVRVATGEHEVRPFALRSNVTLELAEGAVLLASTNIADYAAALGERCFVSAEGATNIAIVGRGVIDGRGAVFREIGGLKGESQPQALPVLMRFTRCRDLRLEDFTYRRGAAWGCHLRNCDGVAMRRVKCFNHVNNTNDGIDIESANVTIEDCDIDADDDAIAFKTESDKSFAVTNVTVRNCRLASCCNAIKFGTGSYADFRDITIENCSLVRAKDNHRFNWWKTIPGVTNRICGIAALALEVVDGGRMDNIVVRNIEMDGYQTPIFVRLGRRRDPSSGGETYLRNVLIENFHGIADSRIASSITGVPGLRPRGITLRNVSLVVPGGGTDEDAAAQVPEKERAYPESFMFDKMPLPAYGFYVRHADGVVFENVDVKTASPDERKPFVFDDCR
jgi:polygalacturonase